MAYPQVALSRVNKWRTCYATALDTATALHTSRAAHAVREDSTQYHSCSTKRPRKTARAVCAVTTQLVYTRCVRITACVLLYDMARRME